LIVGLGCDRIEIGNAAQRQRQRAGLARAASVSDCSGLIQAYGLADDCVLAVFSLGPDRSRERERLSG